MGSSTSLPKAQLELIGGGEFGLMIHIGCGCLGKVLWKGTR